MNLCLRVLSFWALCHVPTLAEKGLDSYVVYAMKRETEEVFCLGGIVSSRTVITACTCIGTFLFEESLNYYVFNEFDARNSVLFSASKELFEIEHTIVNGHCMPSKWDKDRLQYNLGGWKIESSFDLERYAILQPVDRESNIRLADILDGKVQDCYGVGYDKASKTMTSSTILVQKDQVACLSMFCAFVSKGREVDCEKLQYTVLNGPNRCGLLSNVNFIDLMTGTPVFCKIQMEFHIFGVGTDFFSKVLFWTRTDVHPNYAFYRSVYMGTNLAGCVRVSLALVLLSAFKSTMPSLM